MSTLFLDAEIPQVTLPAIDPDKILGNAVNSIRLGVEDFLVATKEEAPDRSRALSSVRNFFAGLLLLLKYRLVLAAKSPEEGAKLIFKQSSVEPVVDDGGNVTWEPKYKETTLDFDEIRIRFKVLGIEADWKALELLRKERNHIEHLYAQHGANALGQFVAGLFPMLQQFITHELEQEPAELLDTAWSTMLKHTEFYEARAAACIEAWKQAPPPGEMIKALNNVECVSCGSTLIKPASADYSAHSWEEVNMEYVCEACGEHGSAPELLASILLEMEGGFNPFDGGDPPVAECPECDHATYVYSEGRCFWCAYEPKFTECAVCGNGISIEEQEFGGLCGYHAYVADRERDR